jgi:hypothetical protein
MKSCLTTKSLFCTWALDDVRVLDELVWQHISPQFYPDLQQRLDVILSQESTESNKIGIAVEGLFASFVEERIPYNKTLFEAWLAGKLKELEAYEREIELEYPSRCILD